MRVNHSFDSFKSEAYRNIAGLLPAEFDEWEDDSDRRRNRKKFRKNRRHNKYDSLPCFDE